MSSTARIIRRPPPVTIRRIAREGSPPKCEVYHVTTTKKARRYLASGCILAPVRYWSNPYSAQRFARKTGRNIILCFDEPEVSYPLPIKGGAKWSPRNVPLEAFADQVAIFAQPQERQADAPPTGGKP